MENNEPFYVVQFLPSRLVFFVGPIRALAVILGLNIQAIEKVKREAENLEGHVLISKVYGTVKVSYLGLAWQTLGEHFDQVKVR